jgi:uncharacterized phage protein (TIGR01671 family)
MRTIKFRAWDKQKKKMLADEELFFQRKVVHEDTTVPLLRESVDFRHDFFARLQERYILMQFTGFKDKNDTEIYEGDIVRWSYRDPYTDAVCSEVAEVVFHKGTWSRKVDAFVDPMVDGCTDAYPDTLRDEEVIGHIYEGADGTPWGERGSALECAAESVE